MQEQGKIRHIGLSEVTPAEIEDAEKIVPIVTIQNRYSLADRRHEETLTYCERRGIGFMPWYPYAGGKLLKADHPAAQALGRIAARHGVTVPQLSSGVAPAALAGHAAHSRHVEGRASRRKCRRGADCNSLRETGLKWRLGRG